MSLLSRRAALVATTAGAATLLAPSPTTPHAAPRSPGSRDQDRWERCEQLARDMLLVGQGDRDLTLDYLTMLETGLPRTRRSKRVVIVGAGIAGLTAGWLLDRAGHQVTILEANGNRVGGRVKTFGPGVGSAVSPFSDPALYAEAGAMRIPGDHVLTLALADLLGCRRRPFYYVDVANGTGNPTAEPPAVEYRSWTGQVWRRGPDTTGFVPPAKANRTFIATNGARVRRAEYAATPSLINAGFGLDSPRTAGDLLDTALAPVRDFYSSPATGGARVLKPLPERIKGWARVFADLDRESMGSFLARCAGWPVGRIQAAGTVENLQSRLALSFTHSFLSRGLINPDTVFWELTGGTATLPHALYEEVKHLVKLNRRVTAIHHSGQGNSSTTTPVWLSTGTEDATEDTWTAQNTAEEFTADAIILTCPFAAMRFIDITPAPSYGKRRAMTELHQDSSTKVLLEFSRRWWEFPDEDTWKRELNTIRPGLYGRYGPDVVAGHTGGGSVTDNPNRFVYFPSHVDGSAGGVVLASYTWADDAARWDSLADAERYHYALAGMQAIYGRRIEVFFTGHGATQSWLRNRYALGEAVVYTPRQLTDLGPDIARAEPPLHYAGDGTSIGKRSWIAGALESACRAAAEINR